MRKQTKIKIRKTDQLRAMLTETLPYEVPLLFSNEGFYRCLKSTTATYLKDEFNLNILQAAETKWSIPYTYKIRKNASEFRSLSVMHPVAQSRVAELYTKYDSVILALCQRSDWTLRAPATVATHYVEKFRAERTRATKAGNVEEQRTGFEGVPRTASSYFVYRKYNFLFKFFESTEFHSLEKQFRLLRKLDISQCFARIYTHTIAWAIKSKKFAKDNLGGPRKGARFEDELDNLMQTCNYNETAGIIVGPEISRIFAEIILQRIDTDIEDRLQNRIPPLQTEVHYIVRRYVDDYFVFANDDTTLETVQNAISDCLYEYKLSLNLTKTETMVRPFSTGETSARIELAKIITEYFQKHVSSEPQELGSAGQLNDKAVKGRVYLPKHIRNPSVVANILIRDVKRSLKSNGAEFDATSNYFFQVAKRRLINYSSTLPFTKLDKVGAEQVSDFLYIFLELLFFFYAMTPRVRQTYIISEITILLTRYVKDAPPSVAERITTKIVDEITMIMRCTSARGADGNIEILNLLIALRSLGPTYKIDESLLLNFLQLELKNNEIEIGNAGFGYFQIVSCLYYIGDIADYETLRSAICRLVCQRFEQDEEWEVKAEMVFLFLDFIRCPHVGAQHKTALVKSCLRRKSKNDLNRRAQSLIAHVEAQDWFFLWDKEINLADVLERKDLRTPY